MEYVTVYEKVTTWIKNTIQVDNVSSEKEAVNKVIECYKQNKDPIYEDDMDLFNSEEQSECQEYMTVEENNNHATVEVMCNNESVWNNAKIC